MEKMSANREMRLRVKPQSQEANRVIERVNMMAPPTTRASRHPMLSQTSNTTAVVAKISFPISVEDFSSAVCP